MAVINDYQLYVNFGQLMDQRSCHFVLLGLRYRGFECQFNQNKLFFPRIY
jgi:hypothetical protein